MYDIKVLLNDYTQVEAQLKELESLREELRSKVLNTLGEMNISRYEDENFSALIAETETFRYTNELAMANWLKANGYGQYVYDKVDTSLNKELKAKSAKLTEGLKGLFVHNYSNKLIVKKVSN